MVGDIDILATQGIVELSVVVETTLVKKRAVSAAHAARGVRAVVDRLILNFLRAATTLSSAGFLPRCAIAQ